MDFDTIFPDEREKRRNAHKAMPACNAPNVQNLRLLVQETWG